MNANDPLALIIAGGGAALSMLLGFVVALVSARNKRNEEEIKSCLHHINELVVDSVEAKGRVRTLEAEVSALKAGTLSREIFDRATLEQNRKLDELNRETLQLSAQVTQIDRGLIRSGYSSSDRIPAAPSPGSYRKPGGE